MSTWKIYDECNERYFEKTFRDAGTAIKYAVEALTEFFAEMAFDIVDISVGEQFRFNISVRCVSEWNYIVTLDKMDEYSFRVEMESERTMADLYSDGTR